MKPVSTFVNAYEIISRLEKKYAPPSWSFFSEVKSSVGFGNRRADGIAVAMWRSLGLEIHGFEVKTNRTDWLRELKDASKSDEIFKYCDRWWVVVSEQKIVEDGELPPTWGMQVANKNGLRLAVKAPKLTPVPLTTAFVAEILRRQFNSSKRPEALELEFQRGVDCGKERATSLEMKYEIERAEKTRKAIEEFEKVSGVRINDWHAGDIGAAVKAVLDYGPERIQEHLEYWKREVEIILKKVNESIAAFQTLRIAK